MLSRCSTVGVGLPRTLKLQALISTGCNRFIPSSGVIEPENLALRGIRTYLSDSRSFRTLTNQKIYGRGNVWDPSTPGSIAFADCEMAAVKDLFFQFAKDSPQGHAVLDVKGIQDLLASIGERPDDNTLINLFSTADLNGSGEITMNEFLKASDNILCGAPARVVLVVGGPGSGKGQLCARLADECNVVHLSTGDLLRNEVAKDTPLGRECATIMARGELVSSAVIVTLVRRRMRAHPGKRVLLDGFPRSIENAHGFVEMCGKPELALHLDCDDTILMERIVNRGRNDADNGQLKRVDDNIETALKRLRNYHKHHHIAMDWLREQHVPVVNLDVSGTPENVWNQLLAIGRLMRPVATPKNFN